MVDELDQSHLIQLFKKMENYTIEKSIGQGTTAVIFLAHHIPTKRRVAIKVTTKAKILLYSNFFAALQYVIALNHPSILHYYEILEIDDYYCIVFEYAENGTIIDYIGSRVLSEADVLPLFKEICFGIQYLHETCNLIHMDIKLENILIDSFGHTRISDFGLSKIANDPSQIPCGSPCYSSPEIIFRQKQTFKSDIWSLGVCLYSLVCGHLPFRGENIQSIFNQIVLSEIEIPSTLSPPLQDLIKHMLDRNVETRFSITDVLNHPWISQSEFTIPESYFDIIISPAVYLASTTTSTPVNTIVHSIDEDLLYQGKVDFNSITPQTFSKYDKSLHPSPSLLAYKIIRTSFLKKKYSEQFGKNEIKSPVLLGKKPGIKPVSSFKTLQKINEFQEVLIHSQREPLAHTGPIGKHNLSARSVSKENCPIKVYTFPRKRHYPNSFTKIRCHQSAPTLTFQPL